MTCHCCIRSSSHATGHNLAESNNQSAAPRESKWGKDTIERKKKKKKAKEREERRRKKHRIKEEKEKKQKKKQEKERGGKMKGRRKNKKTGINWSTANWPRQSLIN